VHVGFSILLILFILFYSVVNNQSVINSLFTIAGYTYGPLLGLFSFGIFTRHRTNEKWVPIITILAIGFSYLTSLYSGELFNGYKVGFEIVVLNGLLVFGGLYLTRRKFTD